MVSRSTMTDFTIRKSFPTGCPSPDGYVTFLLVPASDQRFSNQADDSEKTSPMTLGTEPERS